MINHLRILSLLLIVAFVSSVQAEEDPNFTSLFNGTDFTNWIVPVGDNGHWKVIDGVIDYDAASEAEGDKNLWSEQEYDDFILKVDWRIKETPSHRGIPIVLQDGTYLLNAADEPVMLNLPSADSGIYLRGTPKAQVNIWCWPVGSGEVYGYRNNKEMPAEVRSALTPRINADKPVGEWNTFVIFMIGDRLSVMLNNQMVIENALLPDVPERGKIALQHHGGLNPDGTYKASSSLVQFRNLSIRELSR